MQYRIYQIDQQIPNYRRTKFLIPDILAFWIVPRE